MAKTKQFTNLSYALLTFNELSPRPPEPQYIVVLLFCVLIMPQYVEITIYPKTPLDHISDHNWKYFRQSSSSRLPFFVYCNAYFEPNLNSKMILMIYCKVYNKSLSKFMHFTFCCRFALNGEYAYNKSYSVGYDFGSIKRLDQYEMGALSTLYICFALKKYDSDFIRTYFDSLKWYKEIYMISAEGARNHGLLNVPTDDFFETKHYLTPNVAEQKKIAAFMTLIDNRIKKQRQLVEALKKYKRGLLSGMFPKKGESVPQYRFHGFSDDWEQRKLGEIIKTEPFKQYLKVPQPDGKFEVVQQGDNPILGYANGTPFQEYEKVVLFGDHTLSLYKPRMPFFVATDGIRIISSIEEMAPDYLYYLLERYKPQSEGYKRYYSILSDCECYVSNVEGEQIKIGAVLCYLDHLITLHQRKIELMEQQKRSLMQQLFI